MFSLATEKAGLSRNAGDELSAGQTCQKNEYFRDKTEMSYLSSF